MSFGNYSNMPSTQGYTTKGYTTQGYSTQGMTTQAYTTQGYSTTGMTTQAYTTQGYSTAGMTTQAYTPTSSTGTTGYSPVAGSTNGYTSGSDGNSRIGNYWDGLDDTVADWGSTYSTIVDAAKSGVITAAKNSKAVRNTAAALMAGSTTGTLSKLAGKLGTAGALFALANDVSNYAKGNTSGGNLLLHGIQTGLSLSGGAGAAAALTSMGIEAAADFASTNGAVWNSGLSGEVISGGISTTGYGPSVDDYMRYGF